MDKKADRQIKVFEEIGTRRFGCQFGNGVGETVFDPDDFQIILMIASYVGEMESDIRNLSNLFKEIRGRYSKGLITRAETVNEAIEAAEGIFKITQQSPASPPNLEKYFEGWQCRNIEEIVLKFKCLFL